MYLYNWYQNDVTSFELVLFVNINIDITAMCDLGSTVLIIRVEKKLSQTQKHFAYTQIPLRYYRINNLLFGMVTVSQVILTCHLLKSQCQMFKHDLVYGNYSRKKEENRNSRGGLLILDDLSNSSNFFNFSMATSGNLC